jgi:hypothetical protein
MQEQSEWKVEIIFAGHVTDKLIINKYVGIICDGNSVRSNNMKYLWTVDDEDGAFGFSYQEPCDVPVEKIVQKALNDAYMGDGAHLESYTFLPDEKVQGWRFV